MQENKASQPGSCTTSWFQTVHEKLSPARFANYHSCPFSWDLHSCCPAYDFIWFCCLLVLLECSYLSSISYCLTSAQNLAPRALRTLTGINDSEQPHMGLPPTPLPTGSGDYFRSAQGLQNLSELDWLLVCLFTTLSQPRLCLAMDLIDPDHDPWTTSQLGFSPISSLWCWSLGSIWPWLPPLNLFPTCGSTSCLGLSLAS